MMNFLKSSEKDAKLTSTETFTDSSYVIPTEFTSKPPTTNWASRAHVLSPGTPQQNQSMGPKVGGGANPRMSMPHATETASSAGVHPSVT